MHEPGICFDVTLCKDKIRVTSNKSSPSNNLYITQTTIPHHTKRNSKRWMQDCRGHVIEGHFSVFSIHYKLTAAMKSAKKRHKLQRFPAKQLTIKQLTIRGRFAQCTEMFEI